MEMLSRPVLQAKARELGIKKYSKMRRADLAAAINAVNGSSTPAPTVELTPVSVEKAEEAVKEEVKSPEPIKKVTLLQLRQMCKSKGVKGISKMKRDQLLAALQ